MRGSGPDPNYIPLSVTFYELTGQRYPLKKAMKIAFLHPDLGVGGAERQRSSNYAACNILCPRPKGGG